MQSAGDEGIEDPEGVPEGEAEAVVGAVVGHFFLDRESDPGVTFTIAIIALAGKMARADGVVTEAGVHGGHGNFIELDHERFNHIVAKLAEGAPATEVRELAKELRRNRESQAPIHFEKPNAD